VIVLPADVREGIVARAREGTPEEVCGVLGGEFDADWSHVRSSYHAANAAEEPRTRYRLDPEEALEIFERLEADGEGIVGFYHSHPRGPAEPSETDLEAATWPDRSYVIVSVTPFEVGSWRFRDGGFEREMVVES